MRSLCIDARCEQVYPWAPSQMKEKVGYSLAERPIYWLVQVPLMSGQMAGQSVGFDIVHSWYMDSLKRDGPVQPPLSYLASKSGPSHPGYIGRNGCVIHPNQENSCLKTITFLERQKYSEDYQGLHDVDCGMTGCHKTYPTWMHPVEMKPSARRPWNTRVIPQTLCGVASLLPSTCLSMQRDAWSGGNKGGLA